jgi:predicted enzyme related to lactoylglutathione lyase
LIAYALKDVKKTLAKAKSAGATITLAYHPIGDMGAIGVFVDPTGASQAYETLLDSPTPPPAR